MGRAFFFTEQRRRRPGPRRRGAVALALTPAAIVTLSVACSATAELAPAGGSCFVTTDCQPGLVCVPQKSGARVCSDDLRGVAGRSPEDDEEEDGGAGEGGEAGSDASTDATTPPPTDSGVDTGVDTGIDTGAPTDSGSD